MLGPLANGKITLKEYLATFRQSPTRNQALKTMFIISIVVSIIGVFMANATFVLQNVFITILVWWVNRLEEELTRRHSDDVQS